MGMDGEIDFLDGVFVLAGDDELMDELRRVRSDDVRSEDFPVLGVADDFHEDLRFAGRAGTSVRRERELADLVLELLVFALLLGEADGRDFRMAVRGARNVAV